MRSDMYKVIVERPRKWKRAEAHADRLRKDFDGPQFLGMRAGYGRPALNENLNPLKGYLRAQIGRPWSKVYAEISANIDRRNAVQHHVLEHLDGMIATQVEWRHGEWIDLGHQSCCSRIDARLRQELYVDPRTGIIRPNKAWQSYAARRKSRAAAQAREIALCKRIVDAHTLLLKLEDQWFEIRIAPLPPAREIERVHNRKTRVHRVAERVFDVVLKKQVSSIGQSKSAELRDLYGRWGVYGSSKRQLSKREIRDFKLPR